MQSAASRQPSWLGVCTAPGFALRALRVRISSVMSCAPARLPRGQRCSPRSKTKVCAVTAAPSPQRFQSARLAPRVWSESPRPPRPVSRCGVVPPAASLLARPVCLSFPSAPAKRGLPKGRNAASMRCKPKSRLAPHARACFIRARQGQALRARVPRGFDPMRQHAHSTL